MRLFVAVVPPAEALAPLREAVDALRLEAPGWRFADPATWHLTLAFLGEVAEEAVPALDAALRDVRGTPLTLTVAGAGAFPRERVARVLWAGVEGDVSALVALAASVEAVAASALRRAPEPRAYRPHLTVARAGGRPVDATPAVAALAPVRGPAWTTSEILLVRSNLGGGPARHEPLAAYPLHRPA